MNANPEQRNNNIEADSINEALAQKLNELQEALNKLVESWDITEENKESFIKLWLWDDPSKITEEWNWLIDKFLQEAIEKLEANQHDQEMVTNITKINLQDFINDIEAKNFSFTESLQASFREEENEISVEEDPEEQNSDWAVSQEENNEEEVSQQISEEELRKTTLENRYNELTSILREKIDEAKSLLWDKASEYSVEIELTEDQDIEKNISEIEWAISRVEEDIQEIKNNTHELQIEEEVEEVVEVEEQVEEEITENLEEKVEENVEEEIATAEAQEAPINEVIEEDHLEEQKSNEVTIKKWDNLWKIVKEHYWLSKNTDVANKVKEVIQAQDESKTKQRLVRTKWNLLWVWDKIKLP